MDTFLVNLHASLSEIFAALIAAAVAFVGLIIAKENKTSEFRQAWVDALRQDIADYISTTRLVAQDHTRFDAEPKTHREGVEYAQSMQSIYLASSSSLARIRLRINPDDPDKKLRELNTAFLSKTKEIQNHLASGRYMQSLVLSNALHEQASPILKLEWERVKGGEPLYRFAKYSALAIFIALAGLLAYGYSFAT